MRHEYVVNLRETQRTSKINIKKRERYPETFGELLLAEVLPSRDSEIRVTIVKIAKTNEIFKRPLNNLLPIENTYQKPTKRVWQENQSNAPLTYVCPNTIETCLTSNYLFLADNYYNLLTQHQL